MYSITMGIHCTEKTAGPERRELRFTAGEDAAKLAPGGRTGAVTIGAWTLEALLDLAGAGEGARACFGAGPLYVQAGGWQSWSAGWELRPGQTLPRKVRLMPDLIRCTNREGDTPRRGWTAGHFIMYLRTGDHYLCIASRDGGSLPPVSYRIAPRKKTARPDRVLVSAELFCPGKTWRPGEAMAELHIFHAEGYFNFKDTIGGIYDQGSNFRTLAFLGAGEGEGGGKGRAGNAPWGKEDLPGGYESWYNHYNNINEGLILDDLEALGRTGNLIKLRYLDRGKPAVFQIDDGWQRAVGEWETDEGRFPRGLASLAAKIEAAGFIPGLWIAPFLVTRRSRIFTEKPAWVLREKKGGSGGRPVSAGFNPLWDGRYFCLDLSRDEVLEYLDGLMDRAINGWGFRYLKLDFLYAGFLSGNFAGGGSPHEHYERACTILCARKKTAAGLPLAYLGCGAPLGPSYRHFPLSRIGADTREEWDWGLAKFLGHVGRPGAFLNLEDTIGRSFMDGTVYLNDPDVIFLRGKNCRLNANEKELIAMVNFLLGGQIMFSDDPGALTGEDLALTKRISALYDRYAGDEYGAVRTGDHVYRLISRSGKTGGIINLSNRPRRTDGRTAAPHSILLYNTEG
ncbi:MAG: alpha-galactosidase [Treponema sp.]|jgi:alpha-galactosidase|nr:alpha-galactosidase [Treponema sp.]